MAYIEPAQITPNGVQVYHCVRSHQCIAYCPLLTVCYLCYNWRPHCWAATAVHHCTRLFVTSLRGYDHPPLCSTSLTKPLLTQREHGRRSLDPYRQASPARSLHYHRTPYDPGPRGAAVPCMPQQACTMAAAMKKEPFTNGRASPSKPRRQAPCSRHGLAADRSGLSPLR